MFQAALNQEIKKKNNNLWSYPSDEISPDLNNSWITLLHSSSFIKDGEGVGLDISNILLLNSQNWHKARLILDRTWR